MENFTLENRQLCDIQGRLFELALKDGLDCPSFIESFMITFSKPFIIKEIV